MKSFVIILLVLLAAIPVFGQQSLPPKERILFQKLETTIQETGKSLDGVLGVYVLDLTTGNSIAINADEVFPTASPIKIAILAEPFHQAEQGKLSLNDIHTLQKPDLVAGSGI